MPLNTLCTSTFPASGIYLILLNIFRNIDAGWLLQLNGDASYKICRNTVALFFIGVKSLGHVKNPVCFAIIPEIESAEICAGTYNAVKDAALLLLNSVRLCDSCPACLTMREVFQKERAGSGARAWPES